MMQNRMKENLTLDEALMLLEVERAENATLRQQLAEASTTIKRREAVIKSLEADNRNLELQLESIGAGGVSRLMGEHL